MAKGTKERPQGKPTKPRRVQGKPTEPRRVQGKQKAETVKEVEARAIARFVRISPRKVRPVINLIRRQNVLRAFEVLDSLPQRSSKIVSKVLKSAVANAKQKEKVEEKDLYILRVMANEGVRWKRIRPRAMGRADRYLKRTSHISVIICTGSKLKAKNYGTKSKS